MANFLAAIVMNLLLAVSAAAAEDIFGQYWNKNRNAILEIYRDGAELKGRIIWMKNPRTDRHNPNKTLRERSWVGMDLFTGFHYNKKTQIWQGGSIYAPNNGKRYQGEIQLDDDGRILKIRGFALGIILLGSDSNFIRIKPENEI